MATVARRLDHDAALVCRLSSANFATTFVTVVVVDKK
jgi:hypothetical protein